MHLIPLHFWDKQTGKFPIWLFLYFFLPEYAQSAKRKILFDTDLIISKDISICQVQSNTHYYPVSPQHKKTGLKVGLNEGMLTIINSGNWQIIYSMFCYYYFLSTQHVHVSHVHMAYVAFNIPPNSWDVYTGYYISYQSYIEGHVCLTMLIFNKA